MAKKSKKVKKVDYKKEKKEELKNVDDMKDIKIQKKSYFTEITIALLVIGIIVFEIVFFVKKQVDFSKKPEFVTSWSPKYRGQIGMPVWGEHLYVIDNNLKEIKKYKKMTGELVYIYKLENTPKWVVETKNGDTIILTNNTDELLVYSGDKLIKKIKIENLKKAINMTIDSKDNLYISFGSGLNKIVKYDIDGNKLLEFGDKGKGKFEAIGRIFIDIKNNIYGIDTKKPYKVKIFTENGKFLRDWNLKLKRLSGLECLAITHDGNVYVNDWDGVQILVFSPKGKLIGKFNRDKDNKYQIGYPGAFSGGLDNYLYVGSYSVAIFKPIKY